MTEKFCDKSNGKNDAVSIVARDAPYGNEFTSPLGVCIKSSRLIYYDLDNFHHNSDSHTTPNNNNTSPTIQTTNFEFENNHNMPISMERLDLQLTSNKTVLPLISVSSSPNSSAANGIKPLLIRNGNLSSADEQDLIKDIIGSMQNIDIQRLDALQTEISDYDPYHRGLVDASSLQRILSKFFKLMPLSAQANQKLFRLFATDPKRPRQIYYVMLVQYLTQIKDYMSQNTTDVASLGKSSNAPTPGSSMAQSPFYKRGDAKIILDLQLALQQAKVNNIDVESVRRALNVLDRGHSGTLNREQIENVLKSFRLYSALESVMPQLLHRCNLSNDDQYDWSTIVRFLEKAQPSTGQDSSSVSGSKTTRRDMVSSLDSPTNSNNSYFPPIANNFHVQQTNGYISEPPPYKNGTTNGTDHKKLLEETEMQMKALMLRRQQLEQEMVKKKQKENDSQSKIDNRPRSAGKLIEQLKKLDVTNTGFVTMSNARKVIQQYNDLHELGLNSKFLQHVLALCSNENESHVNLQQLTNYLNDAFK